MVDSQMAAQHWAQGMANAQQKMVDKVNAVTVNPSQLAIAAAPVWQSAVSSPQALAKYKSGLAKAPDWKTMMISKGIPRAIDGARMAVEKFAAAIAPVLAFGASLRARIKSMPSGPRGSAQRKARMNAWFDGMAQYKRS